MVRKFRLRPGQALIALAAALGLILTPPAEAGNKKPKPAPAKPAPPPPPPPPPKPKPVAPKPQPKQEAPKPSQNKPSAKDKKSDNNKAADKSNKKNDNNVKAAAKSDKKDSNNKAGNPNANKNGKKNDKGSKSADKNKKNDQGKAKEKNGKKKAEAAKKKLATKKKLAVVKIPKSAYPACYPGNPKGGDRCSHNPTTQESAIPGGKKVTWTRKLERYEVPREVVAIYRSRKKNLLQNLKNGKIGAQKVTGAKDVKATLKNVDYDDLESFVKKEIGTVKDDKIARTNEIVLLDRNTGEIVGSYPVKGYADGKKLSDREVKKLNADVQKTLANLAKGTKSGDDVSVEGTGNQKKSEYLKVVGTTFHASPIILDLAGSGRPDLLARGPWKLRPGRQIAAESLRLFDLDGKGTANWEWVGPGSGLLVWDPEHTGRIASGKQLFGNFTWGESFKDGYRALERLDQDRDGSLAGSELEKLGVWVDANGDAVSDPGEVKTCGDLGITSIGVRAERDRFGNAHATRGFTRNGRQEAGQTWDWISYGQARPTEGIYVWVGTKDPDQMGGYFKLRDEAGVIVGRSYPTLGPAAAADPDVMVSVPLSGKVTGPGSFAWSTPIPDGSMETRVWFEDEGRHLYGQTVVTSGKTVMAYPWQAHLVDGEPVGLGLRFSRTGEE
ncbi:MAG: hypothetical protein VKO64_02445 [Candidatus Sericytochromatia bacterium]|nr:hypothetical protein [Candidatus Sericytochromatia bacterium]